MATIALDQTRIFVKVAQLGSFSKAADALKLPKSTVSRSVSGLERETGTKLLMRTTRSLTLTAAGRAFYETCLGPIQVIENAQRSLHGQDSMLVGNVRLTAPEDLGSEIISPALAKLTCQHPTLSFELNYTDEVIDLVKEGYDLAIRIGRLNTSSFKAKRLGDVVLAAFASPAYLKKSEKIKTPRDLAQHRLLSFSQFSGAPRWPLRNGRETLRLPLKPSIISNQMTSLVKMALAGAGVAYVPAYLCEDHLQAGRLVRVLPEWSSPGLPVSMISPMASSASARLRVTIDQLSAVIQEKLSACAQMK